MQTRRTPKETLHNWCHYCIQDRRDSEVENCGGHLVYATGQPCPFFPYRMGKRPPMKVFRQFCLECMGGSSTLVRECENEYCPMLPYWGKGAGKERMDAIRSPGSLFSPVKKDEKAISGSK